MKNFSFVILLITSSFIHSQNWQWANNVSYSFTPNGNHLAAGDLGTFYMSTNSSTVGTCLAKFDINGNELWRNYINGSIAINGIAYTAKCVFITGTFENTVIIGNDTVKSSGLHDAFLACATANGNFLWTKQFGGKNEDHGNDICSDKKENIYITGSYADSAKFGTTTLICQGISNMFMSKLDKYGNILLLKSAGSVDSTKSSYGNKIKVDSIGNIVVFGDYTDIVLDTCHLAGSGPYGDQYFCKLDSNGYTQWIKLFATFTDKFLDIELDDSCNILSGGFGGWHYGGSALIRKHKSIGILDWSKPCSGGWYSGASATSIATDGFNSFITGYAQLIYGVNYSATYNFFLLAKFDPVGILKYMDTIKVGLNTSGNFASGADIIRDSNGDFIVVGGMNGVFNLGSYSLSTPNTQIFIAKFSDTKIITSIVSKKQSNESNIYPNPSSGIFTISLKDRKIKTQVCVRDVLGNCIMIRDLNNGSDLSLDLSYQAKGVYFIEIISGAEKMLQKVILQ